MQAITAQCADIISFQNKCYNLTQKKVLQSILCFFLKWTHKQIQENILHLKRVAIFSRLQYENFEYFKSNKYIKNHFAMLSFH